MPFLQGAAADQPAAPVSLNATLSDGTTSPIIAELISRQSVLAPGPLRQVADAVMAANARRAEAELRSATLRAEATEKNWLPKVGPQLSLSSLGSVAAGLVVDQALFDGGRRKAERAVARADVEVAAVALSQNSNNRVRDALDLYIESEAAQARAKVYADGMERMEHYVWVMGERVRGGVTDPSELAVVRQRLGQMRADLAADRERARGARAELAAMAATSLDGVSGMSPVAQTGGGLTGLDVLKAQAEAKRAEAKADAAQAGFMPNIGIQANATPGGVTGGLVAGLANGLGFGAGASRAAIEADREAAQARVVEASEGAARALRATQGRLAEVQRRLSEAEGIARQAAQNYDLYAAQVAAGRRAVPEVIGVFETKLRTAREAVDLAYDVARLRVKLASLQGVLVEGDKV